MGPPGGKHQSFQEKSPHGETPRRLLSSDPRRQDPGSQAKRAKMARAWPPRRRGPGTGLAAQQPIDVRALPGERAVVVRESPFLGQELAGVEAAPPAATK